MHSEATVIKTKAAQQQRIKEEEDVARKRAKNEAFRQAMEADSSYGGSGAFV